MLNAGWQLYIIRHGYFSRIFLKLLSYFPFIFVKLSNSYIQGKPLPMAASGSC